MVNSEYQRLLVPPSSSFLLFGVRGSGKSTWARAGFGDAIRFDLLDEALYHVRNGPDLTRQIPPPRSDGMTMCTMALARRSE